MTTSSRSRAWPLAGLGLLLIALNELSGGSNVSVYLIGGACLLAGLVGVVLRD